jgi:ATP-dependent RNA helicase RhlE
MAEWLPLACEGRTVFTEFGFSPELMRAIGRMGFTKPTPIQRDVIPQALTGSDLLATAETGSGKTAAFLLPLIQRLRAGQKGRTRALIISPTREITAQTAAQAMAFTRGSSLRTVAVYGGVSMGPQRQALRSGCDIVVATPGRLLDHHERGNLHLDSIQIVVIDEADRMMDMGFMPDLRRIMTLLPEERQSLLFAATMSPTLKKLAYAEILQNPIHVKIGSPSTPPTTISQSVYMVSSARKTDLLVGLLEEEAMSSVVVFVRTKHRADSLAKRLSQEAMQVACIHGDRSQREREIALTRFKRRSTRVLVATDVAARGLHVEGITHVINYDVPAQPAEYLNRIGRTARAGASGDALTLVAREESSTFAGIERSLGAKLPRVAVDGLTESEPDKRTPPSAKTGKSYSRSREPWSRNRTNRK